jgi:UDP-N-acetylglucosamine--N-acetylmuramyl-(pentapeptide) pyrophosphoryl-undecaprenol N-acetylglucosamine transferase
MSQPCALIMAGGTGGHIFPGMAVARLACALAGRTQQYGEPSGAIKRPAARAA